MNNWSLIEFHSKKDYEKFLAMKDNFNAAEILQIKMCCKCGNEVYGVYMRHKNDNEDRLA